MNKKEVVQIRMAKEMVDRLEAYGQDHMYETRAQTIRSIIDYHLTLNGY